jgi:hypothetical protein
MAAARVLLTDGNPLTILITAVLRRLAKESLPSDLSGVCWPFVSARFLSHPFSCPRSTPNNRSSETLVHQMTALNTPTLGNGGFFKAEGAEAHLTQRCRQEWTILRCTGESEGESQTR